MIDGVPSYKGLDERALYVIPAGENRGRFIALPGGGADEIRVQSIRDAWDQGKRLQPLKMVMLPDGRLYVDDGRHRTIVAAQQGRDILVRIGRAATGLDIGTVPLIPH
jgi:hypothetical protein